MTRSIIYLIFTLLLQPIAVADDSHLKSNLLADDDHNISDTDNVIFVAADFESSHKLTSNLLCLYLNHGTLSRYNRCRSVNSKSDVISLKSLVNGSAHFAIVDSYAVKQAISGNNDFAGKRLESLRTVIPLYDEALIIAVKDSSDINTITDLKGKRLNLPHGDTSLNNLMSAILRFNKIPFENLKSSSYLNLQEQINSLCNGQLDAMIMLAEQPNKYIKELCRKCEVRLLSIDQNTANAIIKNSSEYRQITVRGGTYIGIPFDTYTVGNKVHLVTHAEVSNNIVQEIMSAIYKNIDMLRLSHNYLEYYSVEKALNYPYIAPLHPGTVAFVKQLKQQAKLDNGEQN